MRSSSKACHRPTKPIIFMQKTDYFKNKTIRLKNYDYSYPGAYFVTICIHEKNCFFGKIENEKMTLNRSGKIANNCWKEIPIHFDNVELGEYIIMPNHVHGILFYFGDSTKQKIEPYSNEDTMLDKMHKKLSIIVGSYKSAVTKQINRTNQGLKFKWQTSFYDHIIRNNKGLQNITEYIRLNPVKWFEDLENEDNLRNLSPEQKSIQIKNFYKKILIKL